MATKISVLETKKSEKVILYKDWKFWYKVGATTIILAILVSSLIVDLVAISTLKNHVDQWILANAGTIKTPEFWEEFHQLFSNAKGYDWLSISHLEPTISQINYGGYIIAHFTYFTVLSNFAIGFWFLFATLKPNKEGKSGYISYRPTIILATFITITMVIWLGLLMPTDLANGKAMTPLDWFFGLTQHAVFPLLFIGYVLGIFKVQGNVFDQKTYMKKEWKNIIFILLGYGIYCLIRGEVRYQGNQPLGTQYPYFFFQIHETKVNGLPGAVWFIIAILVIAGISMGFSSGYNWMINKWVLKSESLSKR